MRLSRPRVPAMVIFAAALLIAFLAAQINAVDLTADPVIPAAAAP